MVEVAPGLGWDDVTVLAVVGWPLEPQAAKTTLQSRTVVTMDQPRRGTSNRPRRTERGRFEAATVAPREPPNRLAVGASAEGVGFEPTVGVSPQRFSRPSDSATLASLQELLTGNPAA